MGMSSKVYLFVISVIEESSLHTEMSLLLFFRFRYSSGSNSSNSRVGSFAFSRAFFRAINCPSKCFRLIRPGPSSLSSHSRPLSRSISTSSLEGSRFANGILAKTSFLVARFFSCALLFSDRLYASTGFSSRPMSSGYRIVDTRAGNYLINHSSTSF